MTLLTLTLVTQLPCSYRTTNIRYLKIMGNSTSESAQSGEVSKHSSFLTKEEQSSLLKLYSMIENTGLISGFEMLDKHAFQVALVAYFDKHIHSYDQFEDFIVRCTRGTASKVIGTFWEMVSEDTQQTTKESVHRLSQLIMELSMPPETLSVATRELVSARLEDFITTEFLTHRVDLETSQELIAPALMSILNNYLPCTPKALETYVSRVSFQGLHSPSYKPFIPPTLDFPSEILSDGELIPLALHSESVQGAWKRLYSTSIDGLSFNRIVYHSLGYHGPTCVLIKCADPEGTVLGMLSFDHWKESNRFFGKIITDVFYCAQRNVANSVFC